MTKLKFEHLCLWATLIFAPSIRPLKAQALAPELPNEPIAVIEPVVSLPTLKAEIKTELELKPLPEPENSPLISISITSGNTYAPHNCTWYAKSRRPDLPNNLGNANTWVVRAAAQGIPTGSVPRAGAIGQQGMHVVYIERVNPDGTVYLSEMNYDMMGGFRYRTASASDFAYIY